MGHSGTRKPTGTLRETGVYGEGVDGLSFVDTGAGQFIIKGLSCALSQHPRPLSTRYQ